MENVSGSGVSHPFREAVGCLSLVFLFVAFVTFVVPLRGFGRSDPEYRRWGRSDTTGQRPLHARLSRRDCSRRITELARAAGVPREYRSLWMSETGGVAALDHRLWAVTPSGWGVVERPMPLGHGLTASYISAS